MDELSGALLEMLENGENLIAAEEAAIELEHAKYAAEKERRRADILEGLRSSIEETFPGLTEYVDWNGLSGDVSSMTYNWIEVKVNIPGFAPIRMSYFFNPNAEYRGATYARVSHRSADFDDDGVEWHEYVLPFWGGNFPDLMSDFGIVLARAKEQWNLMEVEREKWEAVKAELLSNRGKAVSVLANEIETAVHDARMGKGGTNEWGEVLVSTVKRSDYVQGKDHSEGAWQEIANLLREVVEMEVDRRFAELMDEEV